MPLSRMHWAYSNAASCAASLVGGAPVVVDSLGVAVPGELGSDAVDRLVGVSVPQAAATVVSTAVTAVNVAKNLEVLAIDISYL